MSFLNPFFFSDNLMSASKASYSQKFSVVVWCLTSGAQYGIGWWYGKNAVFYLPPRWFGPVQWWLALPFAPLGKYHFVMLRHLVS